MEKDHIKRPTPECLLVFKDVVDELARSTSALSMSMKSIISQQNQLAKTMHGENFDNGIVTRVKELETAANRFESLPEEIRKQIIMWGILILGGNTIVSSVFVALMVKIAGQ